MWHIRDTLPDDAHSDKQLEHYEDRPDIVDDAHPEAVIVVQIPADAHHRQAGAQGHEEHQLGVRPFGAQVEDVAHIDAHGLDSHGQHIEQQHVQIQAIPFLREMKANERIRIAAILIMIMATIWGILT